MIDYRKISYEESYSSLEYLITTAYFIIDKGLLEKFCPGKYPEAEHGTISIEYPTNNPEAKWATAMISPTKDGEDYDWTDLELSYDGIEMLIASVGLMKHDA